MLLDVFNSKVVFHKTSKTYDHNMSYKLQVYTC